MAGTEDILNMAFQANQQNTQGFGQAFQSGITNANDMAKTMIQYDVHLKQQQNQLMMKNMELMNQRVFKGMEYLAKSGGDNVPSKQKNMQIDISARLLGLPEDSVQALKDSDSLVKATQQLSSIYPQIGNDPEAKKIFDQGLEAIRDMGGDPIQAQRKVETANKVLMGYLSSRDRQNSSLSNQASLAAFKEQLTAARKVFSDIHIGEQSRSMKLISSTTGKPYTDADGKEISLVGASNMLERLPIGMGLSSEQQQMKQDLTDQMGALSSKADQLKKWANDFEENKKVINLKSDVGASKEFMQMKKEINSIKPTADNMFELYQKSNKLMGEAVTLVDRTERGRQLTDKAAAFVEKTSPALKEISEYNSKIAEANRLISLIESSEIGTGRAKSLGIKLLNIADGIQTSKPNLQSVDRELGNNKLQKFQETIKSWTGQYPSASLNDEQAKTMASNIKLSMQGSASHIQELLSSIRKEAQATGQYNAEVNKFIPTIDEISKSSALNKLPVPKAQLDTMYKALQEKFPGDLKMQEDVMAKQVIDKGGSPAWVHQYFRGLKAQKKGKK
jgi:hypothetical protein